MKCSQVIKELETAREASGDRELDPNMFVSYPQPGDNRYSDSMDCFDICVKNKRDIVISYT